MVGAAWWLYGGFARVVVGRLKQVGEGAVLEHKPIHAGAGSMSVAAVTVTGDVGFARSLQECGGGGLSVDLFERGGLSPAIHDL